MSGLEVRDLGVLAGGRAILDGVSLSVDRGAIIAVVGANGAGKTTLLDAISGTAQQARGAVTVDGAARPGVPRQGVGRVFQGSPLPETLTVREILTLATDGEQDVDDLLGRFGLAPHETTFVSELSTGMRRIVDLAVAAARAPAVLLLDEPSSGLARAEIERLADLLDAIRARGETAVVLVEHDTWLVRRVADRVAVMDEGRIAVEGSPEQVLARGVGAVRSQVASRDIATIQAAVEQISRTTTAVAPLVRRTLSTWTVLRLGLREFAAGLASVLVLGVLTRVLNHELGIPLALATAVLATVNLAAPIGLPIGHLSDTRPLFGMRRVPYVIGGAVVTGGAVALAPAIAGNLGARVDALSIVLAVALFAAMGAGMYGSGTAFFALIADISSPEERGHIAKVIYTELLAGVFFGVVLTASLVHGPTAGGGVPAGLPTVFAIAGLAIVTLTVAAVWGQERRGATVPARTDKTSFAVMVRRTTSMPQARAFFSFMTASTGFMFLQQAIVQPFGARVFDMSVAQTSGLSGMVTAGTIVGMIVAGRPGALQTGAKRVAAYGLAGSATAFGLLAVAAAQRSTPGTWLSLLLVGLCIGVFNVASLSLMMSMAPRGRAAFFMGAWAVAHALADGFATAGGGTLAALFTRLTGGHASGFAAVFLLEAVGLLACIPLLRRVDPQRFEWEAEGSAAQPG